MHLQLQKTGNYLLGHSQNAYHQFNVIELCVKFKMVSKMAAKSSVAFKTTVIRKHNS